MSTPSDDKCPHCGFPKATHHKLTVKEDGKLWFKCMNAEVNDQVTMYVAQLRDQRLKDKAQIEKLTQQAEDARRAHQGELTQATAAASAKVAAAQKAAGEEAVKAARFQAELEASRHNSIDLQLQIKELEAEKKALEDELAKRDKPIEAVPPPPAAQPAAPVAAPATKPAARPNAPVAPIAAPAAVQPAAPAAAPAVADVVPPGGCDLDDGDQPDDESDDRDDENDDSDEDGADGSGDQSPEPEECSCCERPATHAMSFTKWDGSTERVLTCAIDTHLRDLLHHVKQNCKTPPKNLMALAAMFTPINQ